ncbi:MAG: response regulator, partial [Candidatus Omnitrophica bacterium]|nr:response regulator [Candidatus Omnitrophota bacterium]
MAIKVLIADDEEAILGIMANKVAAQGYAVTTARDGQEAWNKIVSENPDVIILDIAMPKMDGWSL